MLVGSLAERKILELIQSVRVTERVPGPDGKQDIITAYLNQNFYGNNSYGVRTAARGYFGVNDLRDLTIAQAAILAAIPQAPGTYDLVRNAVETEPGDRRCPDPERRASSSTRTRPSSSGATTSCSCSRTTRRGAS